MKEGWDKKGRDLVSDDLVVTATWWRTLGMTFNCLSFNRSWRSPVPLRNHYLLIQGPLVWCVVRLQSRGSQLFVAPHQYLVCPDLCGLSRTPTGEFKPPDISNKSPSDGLFLTYIYITSLGRVPSILQYYQSLALLPTSNTAAEILARRDIVVMRHTNDLHY